MSVVLMYHSLYNANNVDRIDAEDLPYAVSTDNFIAQLDRLKNKRVGLLSDSIHNKDLLNNRSSGEGSSENSINDIPEVVITFDDGHVSNFDIAMPLLADRGLKAYVFVTSNFVGHRAHFCTAEQLAQLARNGMQIGSHGTTHRFFDDLSDDEAERELRQSMQQLSDQSGQQVESISYPGGRYSQRTLELSRHSGYVQLFGSDIGVVKQKNINANAPIKRVAIRRGTSLNEFDCIINADAKYYALEQSKQKAKALVKRTLGNRLYHGLYKSLSAR